MPCWTATRSNFRPPAVPLVTIDPYTSCWSMSDKLAGDWPRHWTGKVHAMCGFVRVDGKPLRFMGACAEVPRRGQQTGARGPGDAERSTLSRPAASMLTVTFTAPLLLDDLELLSRPANYITFDVVSRRRAARGANLFRRHGRMGRQQTEADKWNGTARRPRVWTRCASARATSASWPPRGTTCGSIGAICYVAVPRGAPHA